MTDPGTDPRVIAALAALAEVTDPADVGPLVDATEVAPGVVDLHFASTMPGYVDWRWTVSTAVVEGEGATVLELQLLPGEHSLLAPPWVPWAERLAEWRRSHPDEDAPDALDEDDEESDEDEPDDEDEDGQDEDPFEAAGVEVEDVVVEPSDDDESDDDESDDDDDDESDDDVYGDSGEDEPADALDDDALDDGSDDDDGESDDDEDGDQPFRPTRGGDRF